MVDNLKPPPVGPKLQAARKRARLTLEELSARSGVSRSMLSQVERGQANPTFATLWQLTRALGLNLSELAGEHVHEVQESDRIEVIGPHYTPQIRSEDGGCTLKILSPASMLGTFEWYDIAFEPGSALTSDPHAHGVSEHLTTLDGELVVQSGGAETLAPAGTTVRYAADRPHAIRNPSRKPARALLVVQGRT